MKHVFVETNFLIELLRPSPSTDAEKLFARNDGVDVRLHVPWCSQSEAWRTLSDRIIREDLGFTGNYEDGSAPLGRIEASLSRHLARSEG